MSRFLKIFLFVSCCLQLNLPNAFARVCFLMNADECNNQIDIFSPAAVCPKDMTGAVHEGEKKNFLAYRIVCEDDDGKVLYMPIGCRDGYINIKGANVSCSKVESFGEWQCCLRSNISCNGFVCPAGSIQEGEPCMEYDISGKVTAVKYDNCKCADAYKYSSCNTGSTPLEGSCTTLTGDVLYKGCRCEGDFIEIATVLVPSAKDNPGCTISSFDLVGKEGYSCYKKECSCEEKCEPLIQAPSHGKLVETVCRACDEVYTDYFDFECDEGYKKKDKTCIVATCPQGYSTDYATREMCGEGWDWIYDQSGQSGEIACGNCKCQSGCTAVSSDKNNEVLGDKCCNGKYRNCAPNNNCNGYTLTEPNASEATEFDSCSACGTVSYKIKTCRSGYVAQNNICVCDPSIYNNENGQCVCKDKVIIPQQGVFAQETELYAKKEIAQLGPYMCDYSIYVNGHIDDTFLVLDSEGNKVCEPNPDEQHHMVDGILYTIPKGKTVTVYARDTGGSIIAWEKDYHGSEYRIPIAPVMELRLADPSEAGYCNYNI